MKSSDSRIARSSLANVFGNGFRVIVSFAQTIFVAKWMGVEAYGHVSIILSYTSFLHYLFMLGFDHTLPIFLTNSSLNSPEKPKEVLKRTLYLSLFGATLILFGAALVAYVYLMGTEKEFLFLPAVIIAVQMELSALGYILGSYFRSFKMFRDVIIREQFLFPLVSFLGMFFFIKILGWGVLGYAWGFFAASFVAFVYMLLTIRKVKPPLDSKTQPQIQGWKKQFLFSLPVGLMATLEPIFNYSTVVVSSWQLTASEIGYLGVCTRLGFFMTLALLAMNPIFTPFLASFKQSQDTQKFQSLYQKVIFWCLSWALLSSFVFAMLSKEVLQMFGSGFAPAWPILLAMLPGLFFEGAFGASKLSLVMAGNNTINMYNFFGATVFNAIGIYLGNNYFGVLGGAMAFSATLVILNVVRIWQMQTFFGVSPFTGFRFFSFFSSLLILSLCLVWNFNLNPGLVLRLVVTIFVSFISLAILLWPSRQLILTRLGK